MNIFITGGTGFVGSHLVSELRARGHQLTLLVHRRSSTLAGVRQIEGDVTRLETMVEAASGCDALIHLVGIIREFPSRGSTFERLHVQATAAVLAVVKQAGISRYLHMSALGSRAHAVSCYHQTKFRAEELVRSSECAWTIFRPSLIFGPHDAFVNMLAGQLRMAPIMPIIGSGTYRLQPIHADDVARCFALALEMPETVNQVYELCGPTAFSYIHLIDAIAAAMGKRPPLKPRIPLWLMQRLIPLLQGIPAFPITSDQLQMLLEESICDCRWQQQFRFEPRAFSEGIQEYLAANL